MKEILITVCEEYNFLSTFGHGFPLYISTQNILYLLVICADSQQYEFYFLSYNFCYLKQVTILYPLWKINWKSWNFFFYRCSAMGVNRDYFKLLQTYIGIIVVYLRKALRTNSSVRHPQRVTALSPTTPTSITLNRRKMTPTQGLFRWPFLPLVSNSMR